MHKVADLAKWSPVIERSSGDVSSMSDKASLKSGIQARRARRNYDYEAKRVRESSASDPKRPRRQNACNPCKARRTRCDGAKPCGSCCRAGKTGKQPCEYTQKVQDKLRDPTTRQDQSAAHKTLHAKRVSLRRTIDEFVSVFSPKGRVGQQIQHIHGLWSDWLMHSDSVHASMLHHTTPPCPNVPLAQEMSQNDLSQRNEQHSVNQKLTYWHSFLESAIEQELEQGRLTRAWTSVAQAMRGLDTVEIDHGAIISETKEHETHIKLLYSRLIDWEYTLSLFIGGRSQTTNWSEEGTMSSVMKQKQQHDPLFTSKIALHDEMNRAFSADISQEEGICTLLRQVSDLRSLSSTSELKVLAGTATDDDSLAKQELRLVANVMCMMLNCQAWSVQSHYNKENHQPHSKDLEDLLKRAELKIMRLKAQVSKHAGRILDSFEMLHLNDPEANATSWFTICGVLMATVIVTILNFTVKRRCKDSTKLQIRRILHNFRAIQARKDCKALFQKSIAILEACQRSETSSLLCIEPNTQALESASVNQFSGHKMDDQSQEAPLNQAKTEECRLNQSSDHGRTTKFPGLPYNADQRHLVQIPSPAATIVIERQEDTTQSEYSVSSSFNTTYQYSFSEQPNFAQQPLMADADLGYSFALNISTTAGQTPLVTSYSTDGNFPAILPSAMPTSPYEFWSEQPPYQVWRSPSPQLGDGYFPHIPTQSSLQRTVLGPANHQQHGGVASQGIHQRETSTTLHDTLNRRDPETMGALEHTAHTFEGGPRISVWSPDALHR